MAELYTIDRVARIFGIPVSRLRSWDRRGFVKPSGIDGRRRMYTFSDLVAIRAARELLKSGVPLHRVRKGLAALEARLGTARIRPDGRRVVARDGATSFEPETGQVVLDFDVRAASREVVRKLAPRGPKTAHEWYLLGCRLDEEDKSLGEAEFAYRKAIELDPDLSHALTNLGNLRYRAGATEEAADFYERALARDPAQPEAHYNLGFLAYEAGQPAEAVPRFRRALALDPGFADAHFNIALALSEIGKATEARVHWRRYLEIDPEGPWAEIARKHLRGR
jgi:tetratricopeptide (TPR) repeat protein